MSRAINARQGRPQRQARHQFGLSNLDSFLAHTTPTVPMHSEVRAAWVLGAAYPAHPGTPPRSRGHDPPCAQFGDSASPPGPQRSWFSLQSLW